MKVYLLEFSMVLLWAVFGTVSTSGTEQDNRFRVTAVKDVIFTKGLLFQDTARSLIGCARKCSSFKCCLTFTFNKVKMPRTCRGHSTWNLTLNDDHTHSPGTELFAIEDSLTPASLPANCAELMARGGRCGVRQLRVTSNLHVTAYCDDEWTVFQRRQDGSVDFYRGWRDYKNGFGEPAGEFWLGLEALHKMTGAFNFQRYELRVDLGDWEGNTAYALYSNFSIESENIVNYSLHFGAFLEGDAGDSLREHKHMPFTTKDADHDAAAPENCAQLYRGAWWFKDCHNSHLNGPYQHDPVSPSKGQGVYWTDWKQNQNYSLKFAQMKFRPV